MTKTNKHGLSRHIDANTKRRIRQECGFGCISCGSAIYQYEHIIPEFKNATRHEVDKIGLLCGKCHDNVTRGIWSKESIQELRKKPFALKTKASKFGYLINPNSKIIIRLGKINFSETSVIVVIDSNPILSVFPPEEIGSPPLIKAQFYDRIGNRIAWIDNNEWNGSTKSFDIEAVGSSIKIRSGLYKIDLNIQIIPPCTLEIQTLKLFYNGKSIEGNKKDGFKIHTTKSAITIGQKELNVSKPPFGVSIQGEKIFIGSEDIVQFHDLKGDRSKLSGHYEIDGGELDLEYGNSPYPKIRFKSDSDNGGFGIRFNLPTDDQPKRILNFQKQERNDKCNCGNDQKYKTCCFKNEKLLTSIINEPAIQRITTDIFTLFSVEQIQHRFRYEPMKNTSWLHWAESHPIIIINSSKSFSRNNVGYSLLAWKLIREGYHYEYDLYKDLRHNITCDLQDILIGIPIIDRLKLDGFEMSRHFEDDVNFIKQVMEQKVPKNSDKLIGGVSILESIKMLRLDYNVDYLTNDEKHKILEDFRIKSPISVQIYLNLDKIVNPAETYNKEGYNRVLLNCCEFLNYITEGKFSEIVKHITL